MLRMLWEKTKYRQRRRHLQGVAGDQACAGALSVDAWEVNALVLVGLVCGA